MKSTALLFITLMVGTLATPTIPTVYNEAVAQHERIITGQIIQAIEALSRQIREAGLDPMERTFEVDYELPVPVILSANAIVDNFVFTGLSNIVVRSMNFSLLQSRLTFSIELPEIAASVGQANSRVILFGNEYTGSVSGGVAVSRIRLNGDVRVFIGITSISIRSLSLQFSIGGIVSNLNITLFDRDLSSKINTLLGITIPDTFTTFSREINQLLEIVLLNFINGALGNRSIF